MASMTRAAGGLEKLHCLLCVLERVLQLPCGECTTGAQEWEREAGQEATVDTQK